MDYAIIAAGEGSRLKQEGVKQPKPLVELNGVPLIDRLIRIFLSNQASSINVIVNEEMGEVREHLQAMQLPVPLRLLVKSTPSSMHSFFHLRSCLQGERFCLTTVDTVFKEDEFSAYIRAFQTEKSDGLMAVTDYIDDEKPLYVNVDEACLIRSFTDEPQAGSRYVSGGIYCLKRPALKVLEHAVAQNLERMRSYQGRLLAEGLKLKAYPFSKIVDVDHADDIKKALLMVNG
ncbi:MAG: NTP transferase domain-containing protein [Tannerellaceae bacterium]|jgi:NDP-sugar pyrophosphorylase family protein|nr:NTP transferase domain-containing protein [Tannerellaceae bacterium]